MEKVSIQCVWDLPQRERERERESVRIKNFEKGGQSVKMCVGSSAERERERVVGRGWCVS